jgi:hypothetical protein
MKSALYFFSFITALLISQISTAATYIAFKGKCDSKSAVKTGKIGDDFSSKPSKQFSCTALLLAENDDGSKFLTFMSDPKATDFLVLGGSGYTTAPASLGKVLTVLYVVPPGLKPTEAMTKIPAVGGCILSNLAVEKSSSVSCAAYSEINGTRTEYSFDFSVDSYGVTSDKPAAASGQNKSYLLHNGSDITAVFENGQMSLYYSKPKVSLASAGIDIGTLLFRGTANSGDIKGTAFVFKKGCQPMPYEVQGKASGDIGFELTGKGPVFGQGCAVKSYSWKSPHSRLVFMSDNRGND